MSDLALFLLGPPRVERDGEEVQIPRRKALALLAYLAVSGGRHRRDALATLLWPEEDQRTARAYLRRALTTLRDALDGDWLDADRETVALNPDSSIWLDVGAFRAHLRGCRAHGHPADETCPACLPLLAEAAALHRGDFLEGFTLRDSPAYDDWQFFQTQGLRDERAGALERLVDGHAARCEFEPAVVHARRWLALDPLHEPAHRALMGLYARSGQRTAALRQYAECERVLREELGASPGQETTQLYQAILHRRELPATIDRASAPAIVRADLRGEGPLSERYRLGAEIGRGGMGVVYRGHDRLLERDVAIKVLPSAALGAEGRARILREAQAAAQLNHPNVVSVHDVGAADRAEGRLFIVMELVEGASLRDRAPETLDQVLSIARQVCAALEHAHGHGIVHRDLKPGNVLLAADGTAKLADFGLARTPASQLTAEGEILGTVFYLAPEQALGEPIDGRADLYALGVLLYELTAGQLPFGGEDPLTVISQHLHASVVPPSAHNAEIPPALDDLIVRLLSKRPEDRPASAAEVRRALDELLVPRVPAEALDARAHNLPAQLIPFVGREALLAEIAARLADPDCRLLTLVGPGGSGKTRLALEAAARQVEDYAKGVFFVSLAALDVAEGIVPAIAQALGFSFHGEGETKAQLISYLRNKRMLLILDNYEHLLAGRARPELSRGQPLRGDGVGIVTDILENAPAIKILCTSRTKLDVWGEHRFPVEGMNYPGEESTEELVLRQAEEASQYSAVKLFLAAARRAQPGFALTSDLLADMVRICRLVEGMPLDILLAAARVEMLSPAEIAAEIERGLDILETESRDVPARQRSMRAMFDHSWALLGEREREVFGALSVFRGGFTREAAEHVAGASLRDLMALVNRSLLHRAPDGRYEVHELLRQYAAGKLAESPDAGIAMRDRHRAHYAAALEGWDEALKGPRQLAALAEVEAEVGNVRAAWDWAVERGYVERLGQGMDGLRRFYEWRGRYEEGEAACYAVADALATAGRVDAVPPSGDGARPALRRPPSVSRDVAEEVRARATAWRAVFNRALRRPELAKQLLEESLAQLEALASAGREVRQERAFALRQMGEVLFDLAEYEDARRCYGDSLVTYRALGARWEVASVLHHLGKLLALSGARKKAEVLIRQSLSIRQGLGDHRGVAKSLAELGLVAILAGRMEESEGLTRKSVAAFRVTGDRASIAWGCFYLGNTLIWLGRLAEARSQLEESVAMHRELGFGSSGECVALAQLSLADRFLGNYETARASAQMALSLAQEIGYRTEIGASLEVLGMLAITEGQYVQGQQLLQQACYALEGSVLGHWASADLGYAVRGLGRPDQARRHIREALCAAIEGGPFVVFLNALPTIALLLADLGESERAVELYALASRYPLVANAQWYEDIAGKEIAAVAATLPPEIVAAAQERGRARDLEATVQELLAELEG